MIETVLQENYHCTVIAVFAYIRADRNFRIRLFETVFVRYLQYFEYLVTIRNFSPYSQYYAMPHGSPAHVYELSSCTYVNRKPSTRSLPWQ